MAFKRFGFGAGVSGFAARADNIPDGSLDPRHASIANDRYVYDEFRYIEAMASQGGAAAGTGNAANVLFTGNRFGVPYTWVNIGTLTIFVPLIATTGLDVGADAAVSEGAEILFGCGAGATARGRLAFQPTGDKPLGKFFIRLQFSIADVSGTDALYVGFRKAQAYDATFANYTDVFAVGIHGTTDATQTLKTYRKGGTGDIVATGVTTAQTWADAATHTLGVIVSPSGPSGSGGGFCTALIDDKIAPPTSSFTFAFDNDSVLFPFFRYTNAAGGNAGSIILKGLEIGAVPVANKLVGSIS